MVRINKVTTKTGDKGITALAGGQKVLKSSLRLEAYGCVDELNAHFGLLCHLLMQFSSLRSLSKKVIRTQHELFNLGSQLSVLREDRKKNTPVITQNEIANLEQEIIEMNASLSPLASFVLPGGNELTAQFHIARTVCRRTERQIVHLGEKETLDGVEIPYINRLSDWLFVASRFVNKKLGNKEITWQPIM